MRRFFALGRGEVRWILACLVALALLSADVVTGGPLSHVDHVIRDAIQPRSSSLPAWIGLPGDIGDVGIGTALLVAVSLVTAQVIWRVWPVALGIANLVVVEVAVLLLKAVIGRTGPGAQADRTGYPGYFPSGHTATSAVSIGTAVFLVCTWWSLHRLDVASTAGQAAGLLVGMIAAVRALLEDEHWLSDCIGGLLLSSVVLMLGFAAARRHVRATRRVTRLDAT